MTRGRCDSLLLHRDGLAPSTPCRSPGALRFTPDTRRQSGHSRSAGSCRYCCKSLFALVIKNSPGCRRDFRVKMWGTSSPDDKITGDLGNVIETTQIGGRRSDRLTAGKLSPGNFGLLQQYLPTAVIDQHHSIISRAGKQLRRHSRWALAHHPDNGSGLAGPRRATTAACRPSLRKGPWDGIYATP